MSTRASIGFYESKEDSVMEPAVTIYRHCDGYPDTEHGVIATMLPHLKAFAKERGPDVSFQAAYVLGRLQAKNVHFKTGEPLFTGYGIDSAPFQHGDIEYYYACYPDRLEVYQVTPFGVGMTAEAKPVSIHPYA